MLLVAEVALGCVGSEGGERQSARRSVGGDPAPVRGPPVGTAVAPHLVAMVAATNQIVVRKSTKTETIATRKMRPIEKTPAHCVCLLRVRRCRPRGAFL